jgi:molybdopterin-guanine dinucleotide biosynthesis protein A
MGGGDKCLRRLGGRTVLEHVIERAAPQVNALMLNANGDAGRFARFGLEVVADELDGHAGPLAGVLTGMAWARANAPDCPFIATFATDAPFFPSDMVSVMESALRAATAEMAAAASDGRMHPVFGLWPVRLEGDLREAVTWEGIRKIDIWTARYRLVEVDFPYTGLDPFFNANSPEDLAHAEHALGQGQ